jgi:hypothetical protein
MTQAEVEAQIMALPWDDGPRGIGTTYNYRGEVVDVVPTPTLVIAASFPAFLQCLTACQVEREDAVFCDSAQKLASIQLETIRRVLFADDWQHTGLIDDEGAWRDLTALRERIEPTAKGYIRSQAELRMDRGWE